MIMLYEYNITETDNRDPSCTVVTLKTGEVIEVEIATCIELITNMMENSATERELMGEHLNACMTVLTELQLILRGEQQ